MKTIYKYDIMAPTDGIVEGPIVKFLHVGEQHGSIKVWAEVDTNAPVRKFQILPIGTGWNLDSGRADKAGILDTHKYMGTAVLANGNLVFHIYGAEILPSGSIKIKESGKVASLKKDEAVFTCKSSKIDPNVLKHFL